MKLPRFRILLPLVFAALAAACTRSASTPPPGEGETAGPQDSQQATMEAVRSALLTQTAEAGGGGLALPTEVPTEASAASPTPVVATEEPPTPVATLRPTQAATETEYVEYTVQAGDWVFGIAEQFGVDAQAIVELNNLSSPSQLQVGMVLKIPPTGTISPTQRATTASGGTVHVVQPGEWIYSIARIYGVDPQAIIDANNLTDPNLVYPGLELIIP